LLLPRVTGYPGGHFSRLSLSGRRDHCALLSRRGARAPDVPDDADSPVRDGASEPAMTRGIM